MITMRFRVSGRVQGVWFRASAREQALALGLRGHARNLPDGCVEVLAIGEAERVERLAQWLRHGPPLARVDAVEQQESAEPATTGAGFEIL